MRWGRTTNRNGRLAVLAVAGAVLLSGCVLSTTGDAHVVADHSMELTGTLRSTGSTSETTSYWFEYGPTTAYGTSTSPHSATSPPSGSGALVTATVAGLTPGTTYHYRLCNDPSATDTAPPACGADRTVTTGTGRVTVQGTAHLVVTNPGTPYYEGEVPSLYLVADPGGPYLDGSVDVAVGIYQPNFGPYSGTLRAPAACVRASGNVAVVGYSGQLSGDLGFPLDQLLVIEDNGPTGDRVAYRTWNPADGCPAPSAALLGSSPFVLDGSGTSYGDYTVTGGS